MSTTPSSRSTPTSSETPALPSTRATSPPSSPPLVKEVCLRKYGIGLTLNPDYKVGDDEDYEESVRSTQSRLVQLENLIEKSSAYVKLLKQQMDQARVHQSTPDPKQQSTKQKSSAKRTRKRARVVSDSEEEREAKRAKGGVRAKPEAEDTAAPAKALEAKTEEKPAFQQPALITGATLKDYQLEGVAWMAGLHQNGISGILADEMGLGKTIQTIAFHAFLRERTPAPFMVVCPLAVLDNWAREFQRFAPDIPVVVYYGSKEERAEIRREHMVLDEVDLEYINKARNIAQATAAAHAASAPPARGKATRGRARGRGRGRGRGRARGAGSSRAREDDSDSEVEILTAPPAKTHGKATPRGRKGGRTPAKHPARREMEEAGSSEFEDSMTVDEAVPPPAAERNKIPLKPHQRTNFPVVLTTYQIVINDRAELAKYHWGFIVVDEGHRLKNIDCVLMREIKRIPSAARMVLTGTPLQNNLSELWALLNFVLPEIFGDLATFQSWYDFSGRLKSKMNSEREQKLIQSLHDILRPFLLRRMKADVEMQLPPKKEYVLYTPLTEQQRELYEVAVQGDAALRAHLIAQRREEAERLNGGADADSDEEEKPLQDVSQEKAKTKGKGLRTNGQKSYVEDSDDDEYFRRLDEGEVQARQERERDDQHIGREWQRRAVVREVNNKNLKNVIMQLRKVCQHPFLFHWPRDPKTRDPVLNEELVNASGKMMVLERLLDELFARGHKVLLFSQFTTMLDIIEDWATDQKKWPVCRIDGSMDMETRREDIRRFQEGGDAPDAPRLFLLSTRSGGLGLNLVAADTVIFYDQDWNPQADLQAQDRAHRIGQTRPVLIFRLLCAHTIETKIMERATEKRKLEALVIAKGEFKNPTGAKRSKNQALAELAMELHRLEGEKIQVVSSTEAGKASVISDEDLNTLLDRSPEVFADRQKGWTSSGHIEEETGPAKVVVPDAAANTKTAFAVYEAPANDGNILGMMGDLDEDGDE
ncbi:SNF2 family N-terminal domain-containing protein [Trametes elegans]|nr:SNF2 family N-terminal domain-containing protein [Trametes elegans]